MIAPALRGAWAKVRRAEKQTQALHDEVGAFLYAVPSPYSFPVEHELTCIELIERPLSEIEAMGIPEVFVEESDGRWYVSHTTAVKYRATLSLKPLPIIDWSTALGEIIHDLRCALDYLTWELSIRHQRRHGISPGSRPDLAWRSVQFPVSDIAQPVKPVKGAKSLRDWPNQSSRCLWGIDMGVWGRFEKFQPHHLKRSYKRHPLWVLTELWNADKHRSPSIVVPWRAAQYDVTVTPDDDDPASAGLVEDLTCEMLWEKKAGPLKDGEELCQFVVRRKNPAMLVGSGNDISLRIPIVVNPKLRFQPRFHKSGPGRGEVIFLALKGLQDYVSAVLTDFEAEFR